MVSVDFKHHVYLEFETNQTMYVYTDHWNTDLFMLHRQSGTVSLVKLGHQNTNIFQIISEILLL